MDFRAEQEQKLNGILVKINKLMDQYINLEEKYLILKEENIQLRSEIKDHTEENKSLNNKIKDIKLSNTLSVSELDNSALKSRINDFVKEIDKCMAMLNK